MIARDGRQILDELSLPGRTVVFVDDSGTPGKPLRGLARDFHYICGIAMPSTAYAHAKRELLAELAAPCANVA